MADIETLHGLPFRYFLALLALVSTIANIRFGARLFCWQIGRMTAYDWPGNVRQLRNFIECWPILSWFDLGPEPKASTMPAGQYRRKFSSEMRIRNLVDANFGRNTVESDAGSGSRVIVWLRFEPLSLEHPV